MQNDTVISVLIGLVGACNNNPKTEETDELILTALSYSNGLEEKETIERIRAEKNRIAPGCAACATPCGNTSDYDINRLYSAEPTIRALKQQILTEISQLATCTLQHRVTLTDENMRIFYKALSYVSYDLTEQTLLELLEEIQRARLQI